MVSSSFLTFIVGLSQSYYQTQYGGMNDSVQSRLINLISAVRTLLRIPLIAINCVVIVYELILG